MSDIDCVVNFNPITVDQNNLIVVEPKLTSASRRSHRHFAGKSDTRTTKAKHFTQKKRITTSEIKRLLRHVNIKSEAGKHNKFSHNNESFSFSFKQEMQDYYNSTELLYNKLLDSFGIRTLNHRHRRLARSNAKFLLDLYRDASRNNVLTFYDRLLLGAFGLRDNVRVKVVL